MRRAVSFLVPVSLLAVAVFACEEDQSGAGGPTFQLDGGPGYDGSQPPPIDGSQPDVAVDAPPPPPAVTITVSDRLGPKANVRVVFHDAAGAVLETKLTGANGKATSAGALPAMASALLGTSGNRHIVTWTALENGDDLAIRDVESNEHLGKFNVTLPGTFDAGATNYTLQAAGDCSGYTLGTSGTIDLYRNCVRAQSAVLVHARDENNHVVGDSFKKANSVPTDGGTVEVATSDWKVPSTLSLTATNVPGGGDSYVGTELLEIAGGDGFLNTSATSLEGTSATFTIANGFADALQASIFVFPESLGSRQVITKRFDPVASVAFNAQDVLPAITGADVSGNDSRRPVLTWSSSASTATTDGGIVAFRFFGPADANYHWTFVVAPGATTVTAPAMPVEAESFLPEADAGTGNFYPPEVVFVEADALPSYSAFRRQQGALFNVDSPLPSSSLPALPVNGTYRATAWRLTL